MDPISTTLLIASLAGTGHSIVSGAMQNDRNDLDSSEQEDALEEFESRYPNLLKKNPYWQSLTTSAKKRLMREYMTGNSIFAKDNVDFKALISDLKEYQYLVPEPTRDFTYEDTLTAAETAIDAENAKLLESLNQELQSTGDLYTHTRNQMLTSDYMQRQHTLDAMVTDMSRARRNAIEAGASAGVRIATNVNAILSAQNKLSQQSLETSNQLAQMLVNQRNAERDIHNQWRDIEQSTFDRTRARADRLYSDAEASYQDKLSRWNSDRDENISYDNRLTDRMQTYKNKSSKSVY